MATPKKLPHERKKLGRPTKYSEEMVDRICDLIATNAHGLKVICEMHPELPEQKNILIWRRKYPDFRRKFSQAKAEQAELMGETLLDIIKESDEYIYYDKQGIKKIDPGMMSRVKLDVETRRWTAAKLAPKIYGDHKQIEALETVNLGLRDELRRLQEELDKKNKKDY